MGLSTYDSRRRGEMVRPTRRKELRQDRRALNTARQLINPSVPIPPQEVEVNPATGMLGKPESLGQHKKSGDQVQAFAKVLDNDPVAGREMKRVENLARRIMSEEPDPQKAAEIIKQEITRWRTQGLQGEQ